jgi:hypothetical protein
MTVTGGPAFHPPATGRASAALRDLPVMTAQVGYGVRVGVSYRVF